MTAAERAAAFEAAVPIVSRRSAEVIELLSQEPHAATLQIAIIGTTLLTLFELTGDPKADMPTTMKEALGPIARLVSEAMGAYIDLGGDAGARLLHMKAPKGKM